MTLAETGPAATDAYTSGDKEHPPDGQPLPRLPGYEVLGVLGKGGMGVVYRARHLSLKRLVAVKMIRAGAHAEAAERARFRAEAEAVARLQHPHIVQIHEVGEHDGLPYFSLEFVEGGPLTGRLAGTPQLPAEAAGLVETLARAVHAAHERGVVHRDLKPSNVLLAGPSDAPLGRCVPKIGDFGLAKRLDEDDGQTQTGLVLGTPSYMAPEQARGSGRDVGRAADVYALGAILYEALCGRPPFKGVTRQDTLDQVRSQDPVPVRQLNPAVPRDLETVCLKCLRKEPPQRYASALDLADDLHRFREGRPIQARPVPAWERAAKWVRRYPVVAGLAALVVLVTVTGVALVGKYYAQAEAKRLDAEAEARNAHDQAAAAVQARDEAHTNEERAKAARADAEKNAGEAKKNADEAEKRRREAAEAEKAAVKARGEAVDALKEKTDALASKEQALKERTEALREKTGALQEKTDALAEREEALAQARRAMCGLLVSQAHAAYRKGDFRRADALLDECSPEARAWDWHFVKRLLHGGLVTFYDMHSCVDFSPDGSYLAAATGESGVRLLDLRDGKGTDLAGHTQSVRHVLFSPDGRLLASAGNDNTVRLWDVARRAELYAFKNVSPERMAFNPDSDRFVISHRPQGATKDETKGWDTRTGAEVSPPPEPPKEVRPGDSRWAFSHAGSAASPDGRRTAGIGMDGLGRVFDRYAPEPEAEVRGRGRQPAPPGLTFRTTLLRFGEADVAFSGDGRLVASADATVKLWQADGEAGATVIRSPAHTAGGFSLSPDGRQVAVAAGAGGVELFDTTTGRAVRTYGGPAVAADCVAYSADGKRLAAANPATVRAWDVATGKELFSAPVGMEGGLGFSNEGSVAFSPDGRSVAVRFASFKEGAISVWDVATGARGVRIVTGNDIQSHVEFTPDGKHLLGQWPDGWLTTWDAATGKEVARFRPHGPTLFISSAYSPDGRWLATAGTSESPFDRMTSLPGEFKYELKLWNRGTGKLERVIPVSGHLPTGLAFSADGSRLASAEFDGGVHVWDPYTGQQLLTLQEKGPEARGLAFSTKGDRLAVQGGDGTIRVWDGSRLPERARLTRTDVMESWEGWTPDNKFLVRKGLEGAVQVIRADDGRQVVGLGRAGLPAGLLAVHLDRAWLAQASPGGVRVLDVRTGKEVLTLNVGGVVLALAFDGEGGRLGCLSGGIQAGEGPAVARVWDAATGKELLRRELPVEFLRGAFSADLRLVAARAERAWQVYDLEADKPAAAGTAFAAARQLVWSPAGRSAVVVKSLMWENETVRVFDAAPGQLAETVAGLCRPDPAWHLREVRDAGMKGDGPALAFHLARIEALDAQDAGFRQGCVAGLRDTGTFLQGSRHVAEAGAVYDTMLRLTDRAVEAKPDDAAVLFDRLTVCFNLANQYQQGQPELAEKFFQQAVRSGEELRRRHPDHTEGLYRLSASYHNFGSLVNNNNRPREAEDLYARACEVLRMLHDRTPDVLPIRRDLANTLGSLGQCQAKNDRWEEAGRSLDAALAGWKELRDKNPKVPDYQRGYLETRAEERLLRGDHAEAVAAGEELAKLVPDGGGNNAYNGACYAARAIALLEADRSLDADRRKELAEAYAGRSLGLLRQSTERGFRDAAHVATDDDLAAVRGREDFRKLVETLRPKVGPGVFPGPMSKVPN
jgi:WD40 repeat protein/tetratricopeptide (TPR) repeat protein/tRNA A-37 threonylcarbamoyl transferase component Bud32